MVSTRESAPDTQASHDFLMELGADRVMHSGRSLYRHLCGVDAILQAWGQAENICKAGLFHSVYSSENFRTAILPITERSRLQAVIGLPTERLVCLFAVLSREALLEAAACFAPRLPHTYVQIPCYVDHKSTVPVSGNEIVHLMLVHMANHLEQASKPATGIGFWLSEISHQLGVLRSFSDQFPRVLAEVGTVTVDDERQLHSLYLQGITLLHSGDARAAVTYLEHACRACGLVGEPYLMLAVAHRFLGGRHPALQAAAKGRALLQSWGAPWHKNLSIDGWTTLANLICEEAPIENLKNMLIEIRAGHGQAQTLVSQYAELISSPSETLSAATQIGTARFFSYLKAIQVHRSRQAIKSYPGLSHKPWYDPSQFDVVRELTSRFAEIKAEALKIQCNHYYEEAEEIGRTGSWQVCMFYEQGRRNELVCQQCPSTTAILESHDSVRRTEGLIYLSKMAPNTHIVAHQASSNIRLRCHLAISIPQGDCAIRVGDEVHHWEEGQCIVFDVRT